MPGRDHWELICIIIYSRSSVGPRLCSLTVAMARRPRLGSAVNEATARDKPRTRMISGISLEQAPICLWITAIYYYYWFDTFGQNYC